MISSHKASTHAVSLTAYILFLVKLSKLIRLLNSLRRTHRLETLEDDLKKCQTAMAEMRPGPMQLVKNLDVVTFARAEKLLTSAQSDVARFKILLLTAEPWWKNYLPLTPGMSKIYERAKINLNRLDVEITKSTIVENASDDETFRTPFSLTPAASRFVIQRAGSKAECDWDIGDGEPNPEPVRDQQQLVDILMERKRFEFMMMMW